MVKRPRNGVMIDGERFEQLRRQKALSFDDLAKITGIHRRTLISYKVKKTPIIGNAQFHKLVGGLGCKEDDLRIDPNAAPRSATHIVSVEMPVTLYQTIEAIAEAEGMTPATLVAIMVAEGVRERSPRRIKKPVLGVGEPQVSP